MCKTHNTPVVTSLIGEKSFDDFDACSCHLNCFEPKPAPEKIEQEVEIKQSPTVVINIISPSGTISYEKETTSNEPVNIAENTTHFNSDYLSKCEDENTQLREEIFKRLGIQLNAAATSKKVAGKNPTPKNPPVGISTKGLKKWEGFCKKYQSTWKDYTKIEDKWKVAIAIWIKYAIKHNFPPFNETTDETNQNIVDMLTNRIESNIKTALKAANTFCNMLIRKGFGSKALLDTVYQVEEVSPGKYQIIFRRKITKGDSLKNKDFISFIKARKFAVKQSVYSRPVSTMCTLYLFEEDDELYLESRFICTAQLVSSLLHFDSKSMSKKTVVIKELTKVFKSKLRECRS